MSPRRFRPPWQVEQIPDGYKVLDANSQALAYVYARETKAETDIAKVLTFDEARQIAVSVAKLPGLLGWILKQKKPRQKARLPPFPSFSPAQRILRADGPNWAKFWLAEKKLTGRS